MKIDKEIKSIIPSLTSSEFESLETSIKEKGCRDALVVWKEEDILLDGHHRYRICKSHKIKFRIQYENFPNKDEAKIWVIINQFSRRNLSLWKRAKLARNLKPLIAAKAEKRMLAGKALDPKLKKAEGKGIVRDELGKIAGISGETIRKVEYILKKTTSKTLEELNQETITINHAYVITKRECKKTEKKPKPVRGKFRVIYADPPWKYGNTMPLDYVTEQGDHYELMTTEEICNYKIEVEIPNKKIKEKFIKEIVEKNAVLFLWVTSPILEESFEVIKAWGFKYKASFIWDKIKHNMGHYNSVRHELLLIAVRKSCPLDIQKLFDSVQSIERTKHSKKPEKFREIIDTLYTHGNKIELFARKKIIKGWTTRGKETE